MAPSHPPAPHNRTLALTENDQEKCRSAILAWPGKSGESVLNRVIWGDAFTVLQNLPAKSVDLLFTDPPYNLYKRYASETFSRMAWDDYRTWTDTWFKMALPALKPGASVYVCADWQSSAVVFEVLSQYLVIHNRITWEREKGRAASHNWKMSSEDIWFGSVGTQYYFNPDAVKLKRRVLAPYRADGIPKDWSEENGGKFRLTHPSNLWTDITVPFWSMPENTPHPAQKPEKLVAKAILASSRPRDVVLDPFVGSGTTAVVAAKLGRQFIGIEQEYQYCCYAHKRLEKAAHDATIQGYYDGVFWERNSWPHPRP